MKYRVVHPFREGQLLYRVGDEFFNEPPHEFTPESLARWVERGRLEAFEEPVVEGVTEKNHTKKSWSLRNEPDGDVSNKA